MSVSAMNADGAIETKVIVPSHGDIFKLFDQFGIENAEVRYLWVLRKADFIHSITLGLLRNIISFCQAVRDVRRYDLVYVNTAVIVDFLFASILTRRTVVVHVHEIPQGIAMNVIRGLLIASRARIIFNSMATKAAFGLPGNQLQSIVYNGFPVPSPYEKEPYRRDRPLRLLCIGRLNAWKGQEVLLRACALLPDHLRRQISVRIVGGVYMDQTHFCDNLKAEISRLRLESTIEIVDFVDDPSAEYIGADVVVVPSTLPEPFGRVAIEGMAFGCAVIASAHGGLTEIVQDEVTGRLVVPGDPQALCDAIITCLKSPAKLVAWSKDGRIQFEAKFTQKASDLSLMRAMK